MWFEGYRLVPLQIDQELALQNEKELVFVVVLVPVKFSLHDTKANDAIVHLTKSLVVPLLLPGGNEARYVHKLQKAKLHIEVNTVLVLFVQGSSPLASEWL
jgi:hypothetical protein